VRALQYSLEEAAASLWRGRQSGLLSTATIALALFVLGGFLVVSSNLERLAAEWGNAAEMSVYLVDDAPDVQRQLIESILSSSGVTAGQSYVSKADALARFKKTFGELAVSIDSLGENPLPASYQVRLMSGPDIRSGVEALAARLRQTAGVADVRYDREWLDRLLSVVSIVRAAGLVLGTLLTVAAALTVANVVRLALYARHDEIEIMQLVGAPQLYIRGPFVMEGILQGGIGAALALAVLGLGFVAVRARYLTPLASAVNVSSIRFLSAELCALVVVGGMMVGCVGGFLAARNAR
jgi:cell division transport system permease protein